MVQLVGEGLPCCFLSHPYSSNLIPRRRSKQSLHIHIHMHNFFLLPFIYYLDLWGIFVEARRSFIITSTMQYDSRIIEVAIVKVVSVSPSLTPFKMSSRTAWFLAAIWQTLSYSAFGSVKIHNGYVTTLRNIAELFFQLQHPVEFDYMCIRRSWCFLLKSSTYLEDVTW